MATHTQTHAHIQENHLVIKILDLCHKEASGPACFMSFGLVLWFLFVTGSGPGKSRTYTSIMQIPAQTISARSVLLMGAESSIHNSWPRPRTHWKSAKCSSHRFTVEKDLLFGDSFSWASWCSGDTAILRGMPGLMKEPRLPAVVRRIDGCGSNMKRFSKCLGAKMEYALW